MSGKGSRFKSGSDNKYSRRRLKKNGKRRSKKFEGNVGIVEKRRFVVGDGS
jgi:hypothetical protein